jgi:outer membrane protein assembly factor BamA
MSARRFALIFWTAGGLLWAQSEVNVNSRYLVESVDIAGGSKTQISRGLREQLESLVGQKLNQDMIERVARRMRNELHARLVSPKIAKGTQPEQVIVLFEVKGKSPRQNFDLSLPKAIYHSRQGWSGVLDAKFGVGDSHFTLGAASDGDSLIERFTGVHAGYENTHVGTDKVRLGFQFASYHTQWNRDMLADLATAPGVPGIYRTRQDFAPSVTLALIEPLTITVGTSFQRFQKQFPAAHTEASNAVTTTLRYSRRLEDKQGNKHEFAAGYSLRAATNILDSDYAYARQTVEADYGYRRHHQGVEVKFIGGRTTGAAPLFERFVLGNSSTLRGWDKYQLSPLGGTRVAHGSLEYDYHGFQVFYDTGALWNEKESGEIKHSLGVGYGSKDGFFLAMAFPIKSGRAEPILMAGIAF